MASVGPFLLLLLICSSFLLPSQAASPPKINKKMVKDVAKTAFDVLVKGKDLIGLIPGAGPIISAFLGFINNIIKEDDVLSTLNSEFQKLNQKLDEQLITTTWHSWASGPFQKVELNIRSGWKIFNQLIQDCKSSCTRQKYEKLFSNLYTSLAFAPDNLHMLLTTQKPSFIPDFSTLFNDQFRCHESSIKDLTHLISKLMVQGNIMNLFYYSLHEFDTTDEVVKMIDETLAVMTNIHKYCVSNPNDYIKRDVFDQIDESLDRQQLAKQVKMFLEKTYTDYDWLVVAFITKNSKHSNVITKPFNKHKLSGFIEVKKGKVSVAVAKQVKGNHEKAKTVSEFVAKCLEKVNCKDVIKKLVQCPGMNGGALPDEYTAVHVFRDESHDTAAEEEIINTDEEDNSQSAFIYTGKCGIIDKKKGFRVMIKSDEELEGDLCKNVNCGGAERGKCVKGENIPQVMCECKSGYHGPNCEISIQELKEAMNQKNLTEKLIKLLK